MFLNYFRNIVIFLFLLSIFFGTRCQNATTTNSTCLNCQYVKNCTGENITNSINCINCKDCINVTNCTNCTNVVNSTNLAFATNAYNSSEVYNSANIMNSRNVSNSDTCTNCMNCVNCLSCNDCAGYYCQNDEHCRNSRWKFQWSEPSQDNGNAWKCSDKVVNDWYFNRAGYKKPDYLSDSVTNGGDLSFCYQFNNNRSCCNKQTTDQISSIFQDYKETLQLRASNKIESLKAVFDQYHNIDLENLKDVKLNIQQGIVEEMRQIKITIYNIAKSMAICGRTLLNYVSGMLCLGCLPDWRWEKFVLANDSGQYLPIEKFDPEAELNYTIDLNNDPLQLSVFIGRQICEDLYTNCEPIMENFNQFSNDSALAVGGFADEITNNQWNFNILDTQTKVDIRTNTTAEVKNLSHRNVSWLKPVGSTYGVDTKTILTVNPTADQILMSQFKSSLRSLGAEYPYDPVSYFNFNPSINFEDPIIMNDQMCQLMTQSFSCLICTPNMPAVCNSIPSVYYDIETETDRQYRDFSAYFFQIKVVYLVYNESVNGVLETFVRRLLFPPFREAEIFIELQGQSWEFRKNYFTVLESNIISQYQTFLKVRSGQDEFRIWNDEYWMNFIYSPALTQGSTFFNSLSQTLSNFNNLSTYSFSCELNGSCYLCQNSSCISKVGYQPYCEDCHFSNVRIEANCENKGCITCLYIGGGVLPYNDTGIEEDDLDDEPMDKCFIKADAPFFNASNSNYYAPFYRESDEQKYALMVDLFDLNDELNTPWNIAQIGQWFYKIPGSEKFSVVNVMPIDKGISIPNITNCTHYDYFLPCELDNPINQCKRWLCNFLIDGFFPNFKIVYDPQLKNDTDYDQLFSRTPAFDYQLMMDTKNSNYISAWNLSYGSPDPNENSTYYDVAYWGPATTDDSNLQVTIAGITENTDIIRFVNEDEKDVFSQRLIDIRIIFFIGFILMII